MITKHCTTRTNEVNSAYKNKNKDKQKFHKLYVHEEGVRPRKCKGSIPKKSSLKQPGRKTAVLMLPKRHQSIHFVTPDLTGFSLYVGRKRLRFTFSTHIFTILPIGKDKNLNQLMKTEKCDRRLECHERT